eukprot:scaffold22558_cov116-Cylindrotheca_fusiformis.AAC.10
MTDQGTSICDGLQRLSDEQDKVLAILPIPSATLSIIGSSTILYMSLKSRTRRKWTPYTRLLIGLSIYDIFSSVSISIATFLRPVSSARAWTFGNDATCTASAFFTQFSHSAEGYNAMLSFYFLLTARLGLKNSCIARWFEPMMHFVSIGFYLGTAIVGAVLGVYADTAVGFGCYVSPHNADAVHVSPNCGHEPGNTGEDCQSSKFGWIFIGYPYLFILVTLGINNLAIYLFVREQTRHTTREKKEQSSADQRTSSDRYSDELNSIELDDGGTSNESQQRQRMPAFRPMPRLDGSDNRQKDQLRRLRLVSSQAFLFVASYVLVVCWSGMLAIAEQQAETREEELAASVKLYPLMVLNAIFLPLQGFFNMLVYIRPTYLKWRHRYPKESRPWAFRRAVFGESIQPERSQLRVSPDIEHDRDLDKASTAEFAGAATGSIGGPCRLNTRDKISTLTASNGDFDHRDFEHAQDFVKESTAKFAGKAARSLGDTYCLNRRDSVSTLTASDGDFDAGADDESLRATDFEFSNHTSQRELPFSLSSKVPGLEVISELSASVFEPIMPILAEDNSLPPNSEVERLPSSEPPYNRSSKRRWSSSARSGADGRIAGSLALRVPKRWESGIEVALTEDGSSSIPNDDGDETCNLDSETRSSHSGGDTPIRVPVRRLSPPPSIHRSITE